MITFTAASGSSPRLGIIGSRPSARMFSFPIYEAAARAALRKSRMMMKKSCDFLADDRNLTDVGMFSNELVGWKKFYNILTKECLIFISLHLQCNKPLGKKVVM